MNLSINVTLTLDLTFDSNYLLYQLQYTGCTVLKVTVLYIQSVSSSTE
jgi:hypothetical protein